MRALLVNTIYSQLNFILFYLFSANSQQQSSQGVLYCKVNRNNVGENKNPPKQTIFCKQLMVGKTNSLLTGRKPLIQTGQGERPSA